MVFGLQKVGMAGHYTELVKIKNRCSIKINVKVIGLNTMFKEVVDYC